MSATPVSQARVMSNLAGVAVVAPLGAAMNMSTYRMPAILALRRGDVSAIRSTTSNPPETTGLGYLVSLIRWKCRYLPMSAVAKQVLSRFPAFRQELDRALRFCAARTAM